MLDAVISQDFWAGWIDVHSHLSDVRLDEAGPDFREAILATAQRAGFTGFVQAGVDPADWDRQLELQKKYSCLVPVFGLHPYAVHSVFKENTPADAHKLLHSHLDKLARYLHRAPLLGETGLDLRPAYEESEHLQLEAFETQLEMAEMAKKPVVLHLVRAFKESETFFDVWGGPKFGGFVHAFGGGPKEAGFYVEQGLMLSVGASLIHPKSTKLRQAVKDLDMDYWLLESDSPDQAAFDAAEGELNTPLLVLRVAKEIAALKGMTESEVLARSRDNFRRLLR